jgi:hypothetical protein
MARQAEALAKAGRASGYCALYSGLEDRRVSLNTYAREEWNPVLELHQPLRFCKPPPELIGQRDMKMRTEVIASARDDCVFCVLNPIYLRICLARIFSLF